MTYWEFNSEMPSTDKFHIYLVILLKLRRACSELLCMIHVLGVVVVASFSHGCFNAEIMLAWKIITLFILINAPGAIQCMGPKWHWDKSFGMFLENRINMVLLSAFHVVLQVQHLWFFHYTTQNQGSLKFLPAKTSLRNVACHHLNK